MPNWLAIMSLLLMTVNAVAMLKVARSPRYDAGQKRAQFAIIWLVPVFGASLVWALASENIHQPVGRRSDVDGGDGADVSFSGDGDSFHDAGFGGGTD